MRMERKRRFAPEVLQAVADVREAQTPRCKRKLRELYRETCGGDALQYVTDNAPAQRRGRRFEWYRDDRWRRVIRGA